MPQSFGLDDPAGLLALALLPLHGVLAAVMARRRSAISP
jgi:hypothetical protein